MKSLGFVMASMVVVGVACGDNSSVPPLPIIDGPVTRYVVDAIPLPSAMSGTVRLAQFGDDLDGNGVPDNQIGAAVDALGTLGDGNRFAADMIASGRVASSVLVQTDEAGSAAAVRYLGSDGDLGDVVAAIGTFDAGRFRSQRTAHAHVDASATLVYPALADADPLVFPLHDIEIDLDPDAGSGGGYTAILRGRVAHTIVEQQAQITVVQMISARPADHHFDADSFDKKPPFDVVTADEVADDGFLNALIAADLGSDCSAAVEVHLRPCVEGTCVDAPPTDTCHDRVLDGDETGLDCGGSCEPCAGGEACVVAADCQTLACDSGVCDAPSCTDGKLDGFEDAVDCGGSCKACPVTSPVTR